MLCAMDPGIANDGECASETDRGLSLAPLRRFGVRLLTVCGEARAARMGTTNTHRQISKLAC
jgi:hypothetical protein